MIGLAEQGDLNGFIGHAAQKLDIESADILESFRDGPKSPKRPRIIKIKFRTSAARRRFLTGFQGIRGGLQMGDRVWVRPDLTFRQRQEDRRLRDDLKRRRDAGEEVKIARGRIVPK